MRLDAEPVEDGYPSSSFRPSGAKEFLGDRRKDVCARYFLRPFRADVLKHKRSRRTPRCVAAGAPPVATVRRPVGAKNGRYKVCPSGRVPGPRIPIPGRWPSSAILAVSSACPPLAGPSPLRPVPFFMDSIPIGTEVVHNGVCTSVHVQNHQIRVKIDQKGDVFRQKGTKKARISSCPS